MARYTKESLVEDLQLYDIFAEVSKAKTRQFVEELLQTIQDRVVAGDEVTFAGFGKFYKFEKTKDGKPTGTIVPKFAAFKDLKEAVA